jgi:phytanoyl-CoA hydroxylase
VTVADVAAVERDYRRNGYAVLREVLSGDEVAAINARISDIQGRVRSLPASLADHLVMERDLPLRSGDEAYAGDSIFILGSPPAFHPTFAALAIHPVIIGLARALLQTDAIAYHFSNVTTKRPVGGRAIAWHRDYPNKYISQAAPTFMRIMVCLDGMTEDNGATAFFPGSHLVSDEEAGRKPLVKDVVETRRAECAVCPAGSLVLIHPKVIHGGGRNVSLQSRRNFVVQWGDARAPFSTENREILTGLGVSEIEKWLGLDNARSTG